MITKTAENLDCRHQFVLYFDLRINICIKHLKEYIIKIQKQAEVAWNGCM